MTEPTGASGPFHRSLRVPSSLRSSGLRSPGLRSSGSPERIGPTAVSDRALAPDLARGAMLLLIALANAHLYLYGQGAGLHGYPAVEAGADRWVTVVQMTLVDGRAYPMFAALFGYGLVQLYRRRTAAGEDEATAGGLIQRRGWWLIAIGFVHGVLLFSGDIIGAYGLIAVVLAGWLLSAGDRTLLVAAALWLIPGVALGAVEGMPGSEGQGFPSLSETNVLLAFVLRAVEWAFGAFVAQAFVPLPAAVIFGMWAARRRLLDNPEQHRSLLIRTATAGLLVSAVGGFPLALLTASVWSDPPAAVSVLVSGLHTATGYAGGMGYAALAGLVAIRVRARAHGDSRSDRGDSQPDRRDHQSDDQRDRGSAHGHSDNRRRGRRGRVVAALAACGQWSMSCYLAQSVIFVAVLASYGGGLGDQLGVAAAAVIAVATWILTVVVAAIFHRRGHRGPAETLLRTLTYQQDRARQPR